MNKVVEYTPAQLEPATGRQLRTIALLCMGLKVKEPLEERPMTMGEAGRLIRDLISEVRFRRKDDNTS